MLTLTQPVRYARSPEAPRRVITAAVVMLIPLPAPPAVRKIIDFQHEINLFSQYATGLSNASVPYLPFDWIPKTTGSLQKTVLLQSAASYNEHVPPHGPSPLLSV